MLEQTSRAFLICYLGRQCANLSFFWIADFEGISVGRNPDKAPFRLYKTLAWPLFDPVISRPHFSVQLIPSLFSIVHRKVRLLVIPHSSRDRFEETFFSPPLAD